MIWLGQLFLGESQFMIKVKFPSRKNAPNIWTLSQAPTTNSPLWQAYSPFECWHSSSKAWLHRREHFLHIWRDHEPTMCLPSIFYYYYYYYYHNYHYLFYVDVEAGYTPTRAAGGSCPGRRSQSRPGGQQRRSCETLTISTEEGHGYIAGAVRLLRLSEWLIGAVKKKTIGEVVNWEMGKWQWKVKAVSFLNQVLNQWKQKIEHIYGRKRKVQAVSRLWCICS